MCAIAIVDDHHILLDGLKWVISQYHFIDTVSAFSSAEQLIEAIEGGELFEAVVTDLQMPAMNGHDLISHLNRYYPQLKILVMTMFDSPFVIRKVMQSNANGFFIKQGDQSTLEEALKAVLNGDSYWPKELAEIAQVQTVTHIDLTKRESEIISLIAQELSTKMIAQQLFISEDTVLTHRKNIMSKLNIHSSAGLVAFAIKNNLM
ncbi:MAG: response regulator transcription factor [Sphingobacteriaceae bacterium]|nr:response regulator transcription factor [Sphingobacteriaceae bacterium]